MLGQIRNFENYPTFSAIDIFYSHVILFFEWDYDLTGWYHPCSGHELGQTWGDGEGEGGLACGSP